MAGLLGAKTVGYTIMLWFFVHGSTEQFRTQSFVYSCQDLLCEHMVVERAEHDPLVYRILVGRQGSDGVFNGRPIFEPVLDEFPGL